MQTANVTLFCPLIKSKVYFFALLGLILKCSNELSRGKTGYKF